LAGRGGLCAPGPSAPCDRHGHSGRIAALEKVFVRAGHDSGNRASFRNIRAQRYDEIVDTQGLLRTAILTRAARGMRHGYDASSVREPLASLFYDVRHRVERNVHAVERNRILSGLALGYAPDEAPDFGLDRARIGKDSTSRYGLLLHATARREKQWPDADWIAFAKLFLKGSSCYCRGERKPSAHAVNTSRRLCQGLASPIVRRWIRLRS